MSSRTKRIYNSDTRQARAVLTRRRVLDAARILFQAQGFEGVTIEQLAQAASVSAPTIYTLFQSKRGVLLALMDEALPTEQREALVEEVSHEQSPKARIALAAKITRQMYDAERAQMDIFQGASILAPEFKELEREREQRRYTRQEESMQMMVRDKALAKGLSLSKARDILWAFTGRDMYRMFVIERGWSSDGYEAWLTQALVKTLLGSEV